MNSQLAHIVARANISRLSLIGLAKNVGKTTTTNHLLETLLDEQLYRAQELALTSLGLDGEAIDALTGLPKPRYMPQAGVLVATTAELLHQAESRGVEVEPLLQLLARTALGPVVLARIVHPGGIIIAGPTLLRDLRGCLDEFHDFGARLCIVDGAINRLGAASPSVTDACILCTGASAGATPELVARRTTDIFLRLSTPQTGWSGAYKNRSPHTRLIIFSAGDPEGMIAGYQGQIDPALEAKWIASHLQMQEQPVFLLRGALSEELSRALLATLPSHASYSRGELIAEDATKIFCHPVVLQQLAAKGIDVRVANGIRILALTINPYTPEYDCTPQRLLDALLKELPPGSPPVIDVVAGLQDRDMAQPFGPLKP